MPPVQRGPIERFVVRHMLVPATVEGGEGGADAVADTDADNDAEGDGDGDNHGSNNS